MSSFYLVALFGVFVYFCGSKVFDCMDGIQREEWNVAAFESTLQHFGRIKYQYMGNLTQLEVRQNRILNLSYADIGDLDTESLKTAMVQYLQSLNESKLVINESVTVMQSICDQAESLVETVRITQQNMMNDANGTKLSPYNPTRLIWNVYYIYTGMQLTEKHKEYLEMLRSLCLQSKRVLDIQRDFMQQTRFTEFLALIKSDIELMTHVEKTRNFVDEVLFFEFMDL